MWYLDLAPATLGAFDPFWSDLQNLEPGLRSGSLPLLTKETTVLKVYKRKNNPRVHPCITATEGWANTASWRLKASERLLGHLAASTAPQTRSALFLKCCFGFY